MGPKSQAQVWAIILGLFAAASCTQILFYGLPALLGFGAYHFPPGLYPPAVLLFFFGPAIIATWCSIRILRSAAPESRPGLRAWAIAVVSLLAILSAYVGVYISLNAWGT
jgi:hypothetical protein